MPAWSRPSASSASFCRSSLSDRHAPDCRRCGPGGRRPRRHPAAAVRDFLVGSRPAYRPAPRRTLRAASHLQDDRGFTAQFPPYPLDGELYSGRGQFEQISAAVRSSSGDWRGIRLHVFDVPKAQGNLYQRLAVATQWLKTHPNAPITIIPQTKVRDRQHAMDFLKQIEAQGGEGVMLRQPESRYSGGRSSQLLKLKSQYDDECTVTRHYEGKGRNAGRLGAVGCKNQHGEFRIGSGFKDKERDNPPKIGAVITYRYRGFTQKGTPKFATFVRVRTDR